MGLIDWIGGWFGKRNRSAKSYLYESSLDFYFKN